jgi:Flp pilus assembly protein TadB
MAGEILSRHLTLITSGPLLVLLVVTEHRRRRRVDASRRSEQALVQLVDDLITGLRSGASLIELTRTVRESTVGKPVVADDPVGLQLLLVTTDQLVSKGGPAIPALQRLRHTLMGRVNGRRLAEAQSAQAVASAGMLLLAPVVFAAAVSVVDPAIARFYLSEPLGSGCVFCALVLAGGGWAWMQAVTNSVLRDVR